MVALFQSLAFVCAASLQATGPRPNSAAELFLPALEHRSRPVEAWMSDLRRESPRQAEALWSLYYWNDRSDTVVDLLRSELTRRRAWQLPPLAREIDAILDDWRVDHQCLDLDEYWDPEMTEHGPRFLQPSAVFENRFEPSVEDDATLLEELKSVYPSQRTTAACSLILRQHEVRPAVRAIVHAIHDSQLEWEEPLWFLASSNDPDDPPNPILRAFPWAWEFAGTEAERALADLLVDPDESTDVKRTLLDRIGLRSMSYQVLRDDDAIPSALAELSLGSPLAASARRELLRVCNVDHQPAESWVHWRKKRQPPLDRPLAELALARVCETMLRESIQAGAGIDTTLLELQAAALRSETVRDAIRPMVFELLDRTDNVGVQALRLLCHLGEDDARVRDAYLRLLPGLAEPPGVAGEYVPCLEHHDARTTRALEALFERTSRKERLQYAIQAGGFCSGEGSPLANAYASYLDRAGIDRWRDLYDAGFSGLPEPRSDDKPFARVVKLGIRARTHRVRAEDPSEDLSALWNVLRAGFPADGTAPSDFYSQTISMLGELDPDREALVDWGLDLLLDYWDTLSYHQYAVANVLRVRELTRRQQAILCAMDVDVLTDDWTDLLGRQGAAAIERVVDVRRSVYAGGLGDLRNVLKITHMSKLDEEIMLRALGRGTARDREEMLAVIRDFALDTPELRGAVKQRLSDCDDLARGIARSICDARGW